MNSSATVASLIGKNCINAINAVASLFGVIGNIVVLILVCRYSYLRKHCKFLQAALAAGDVLLCAGQLMSSLMNILIANYPVLIVRWACLILATPGAWAVMYSMCLTICMAADRFYAIMRPIQYRTLPKFKLCMMSVLVSALMSLACAVATLTDVNFFDYPAGCVGSASRSARFAPLINYFGLASGCVVLVIYPVTLLIMRHKAAGMLKSNSRANAQNNAFFLKQVEVTSSITCVVFAGFFLYAIPNAILIMLRLSSITVPASWDAPSYVGLGLSVHSSINCLFYIWKDKEMRAAFKNFAGAKNQITQVHTMTVTNGNFQKVRD